MKKLSIILIIVAAISMPKFICFAEDFDEANEKAAEMTDDIRMANEDAKDEIIQSNLEAMAAEDKLIQQRQIESEHRITQAIEDERHDLEIELG